MSDVVWLFIAMIVIGAAAFSPLGYFIYMFSHEGKRPFGETEPHGDSPSLVNAFAEKVIALVKGFLSKNKPTQ